MNSNQVKFQKNINGLRAIAVLSVVLFHFQLFNVASGFVGVDIFFVISGYLMTKILFASKDKSLLIELKGFYINRIRRITPAFALVAFSMIATFSASMLYVDFSKLLKSNIASNLFFSNYFYYLVQGGYFESAAENNPLLHTWSLSLEWQFYLAYPIVILVLRNTFKPWALKVFLLILLTCSLFFSIGETYSNSSYAYYALETRVWEFIVGGLVAIIHLDTADKEKEKLPIFFQGLFFIGLVLSIFLIDKNKFPGWQAIFPVFLTAAIIYDRSDSVLNKCLSFRPIQFIGDVSYSLYLWHWVVFSYISIVLVVDRSLSFNEKSIGVLISILLAYTTFKFVEQSTRGKNGFWSNKRIVLVWSLSILLSIFGLIFFSKSENSNLRLPEYMRRVELGMEDKNPNLKACMSGHEEAVARGFIPKFCKFGANENNDARLMLWGDSHADAVQPAIDFALIKRNLAGIASTASGCAPFDGIGYSIDKLKESFSHCGLGHGEKTFELIINSKSIEYVIMHADWSRYDFKILKEELVPQACAMKAVGKKVILIGQVPIPNFDVPRVWASKQLKNGHSIKEILFDESLSNAANILFNNLVSNIETSCGDIRVIFPADGLCESGKCYAVKDGKTNYVDTGHLSATGSINIRDLVLKKLSEE